MSSAETRNRIGEQPIPFIWDRAERSDLLIVNTEEGANGKTSLMDCQDGAVECAIDPELELIELWLPEQ